MNEPFVFVLIGFYGRDHRERVPLWLCFLRSTGVGPTIPWDKDSLVTVRSRFVKMSDSDIRSLLLRLSQYGGVLCPPLLFDPPLTLYRNPVENCSESTRVQHPLSCLKVVLNLVDVSSERLHRKHLYTFPRTFTSPVTPSWEEDINQRHR